MILYTTKIICLIINAFVHYFIAKIIFRVTTPNFIRQGLGINYMHGKQTSLHS